MSSLAAQYFLPAAGWQRACTAFAAMRSLALARANPGDAPGFPPTPWSLKSVLFLAFGSFFCECCLKLHQAVCPLVSLSSAARATAKLLRFSKHSWRGTQPNLNSSQKNYRLLQERAGGGKKKKGKNPCFCNSSPCVCQSLWNCLWDFCVFKACILSLPVLLHNVAGC